VDLTQLADISQPVKITDLGADVGKEICLRYQADAADTFAEDYKKNTGLLLAEHIAANDSIFADGETVVENNLFAPTFMSLVPNMGFANTKLPCIISDHGSEYLPRILYFEGMRNCAGNDYFIFKIATSPDGATSNAALTLSVFPFAYSYDDSQPNDNSLYFNDIGNLKGLFERFYYNAIKTINESKRIEAYFNIDSNFIEGFISIFDLLRQDFRARYFLKLNNETIYARLEQIIDYDPESRQTTKMILVRDVDRIK
jgi:hypothetical protein